jgi:hypothetical protein
MTDPSHLELLASYEEALEAARRSLTIARELAEAHRSGQRPHEAALTTYLPSIELVVKGQLPANLRDSSEEWSGDLPADAVELDGDVIG